MQCVFRVLIFDQIKFSGYSYYLPRANKQVVFRPYLGFMIYLYIYKCVFRLQTFDQIKFRAYIFAQSK